MLVQVWLRQMVITSSNFVNPRILPQSGKFNRVLVTTVVNVLQLKLLVSREVALVRGYRSTAMGEAHFSLLEWK